MFLQEMGDGSLEKMLSLRAWSTEFNPQHLVKKLCMIDQPDAKGGNDKGASQGSQSSQKPSVSDETLGVKKYDGAPSSCQWPTDF